MNISLVRPLIGGMLSQKFGMRPEAYARFRLAGHNGLDYATPIGTQIRAAHSGFVSYRPDDPNGYGICIRVIGLQFETLYAHLSSILVPDGTQVEAKDVIALSGNTGNSTGPHLHFGLRVFNMNNQAYSNWIDPTPFRDV